MNALTVIRQELAARFPAICGLNARPLPIRVPGHDATAIVLGRDQRRKPLGLALRVRLEHLLIVGSTGSGKTRLLRHYLRQAIANGEGAFLLDPHGDDHDSAYRTIIQWLATQDRAAHIIDFSSPHTIGFNPLYCPPDTDPSVIAGNMLDAMGVSWEGESLAQKPSIERRLTTTFSALADLGLTLVEAPMLLDREDSYRLRAYAIEHVRDPYTREDLRWLDELAQDGRRKREYDQEVIGPKNRLQRLLSPPVLRMMLGQRKNNLDIRAAMDNGEVILANLNPGTAVYEKDADLFGKLILRLGLFHAKRRTNKRPVSVIADEAHRFLSADIPTLLAEVRKYGVSLVCAMQWLEQAATNDENILAALMNGTNCKIIFRLRDAEDSERLAQSNVPLDLETPVEVLKKNTVVGHIIRRLKNKSESDQQSVTDSQASTAGVSEGFATTDGRSVSVGTTHISMESEMHSVTDMHSASHGNSDGSAAGASAGAVMTPTGEFWHPQSTSAETEGTNNIASFSHSSASSDGRASSDGTAITSGTAQSENYGLSRATTKSYATMSADTKGKAKTLGNGRTEGYGEAFEPVMKYLPTAVHSKDNMLYRAGLMLRSLPTGVAYLNYVGAKGAVSTLFTVPLISTPKIEPAQFADIRDKLIASSPAALPCERAMANITMRHEAIRALTAPKVRKPKPKKKPVIDTPDEKGTWG